MIPPAVWEIIYKGLALSAEIVQLETEGEKLKSQIELTETAEAATAAWIQRSLRA
jgi:hypothetical protein